MVLEQASDPNMDPDVTDELPASDNDPYETRAEQIRYDRSVIARPLPVLGPLFGFSQDYIVRTVETNLTYHEKILKRPLTEDEATSIAGHSSRMLATASYGVPAGPAAGLYRAYVTRRSYRFPLWQPKPDQLPIWKFSFLVGRHAKFVWQCLRYLAYGTVGHVVGTLFVYSYAGSVMAVKERRDPALKEHNKELMAKAQEIRDHRRQKQGEILGSPGAKTPGPWGSKPVDDASPAQMTEGVDDLSGLSAGEDDMLSDQQIKARETQSRASPARRGFRARPRATEDTESGGAHDDASPTSGFGSIGDESGEGGSTWDRIRRNAGAPTSASSSSSSSRSSWPSSVESTSTTSPAPSSSSPSNVWPLARANGMREERSERERPRARGDDPFAIANSAEERHLAEAESRRAFDEKLERERQAEGFDEDKGRETTWRGRRW